MSSGWDIWFHKGGGPIASPPIWREISRWQELRIGWKKVIHWGEWGEVRRRGRAWPDSTGCGAPALPPLCLSEVELNVTKPRWGWATALSPCSPPTQQDEPFGERVNLQSSLSVALRRRQTLLEDSWLLEAERQCSFTIFPLQVRLCQQCFYKES